MRTHTRFFGTAIAAGALLLGGCTDWLSVKNPTVIDNDALDPVADANLLARSAEKAYTQADRKGLGEQDFAAVVEVVEAASSGSRQQKTT